jgi:xanthine dehydrogenase YagT iron-sulfur-binding subunit
VKHSPTHGEASASGRRAFFKQAAGIVAAAMAPAPLTNLLGAASDQEKDGAHQAGATLRVNGRDYPCELESRTTLLDALRDRLKLTGTKKGCDHGTCGACTVHIDGRRVLSCLTLARRAQGHEVTTIEGLSNGEQLHPAQAAFVQCDGFQCGFCTPGQIMSTVACIREGHTGSDDEIREWMSGNLCRCAAYPNIVDAVKAAARGGAA